MLGCLLALVALATPRLVLAVIWLATDWFDRAFETALWPLLGWILMPYTTAAYMAAMLNNDRQVGGWWLVLLIVAVLADLGSNGSSRVTLRKHEREEM
ncbi:MAG: hypothetical protein NTU94_01940 [Planctomycetota bacterium]|nr:hypothetical protein [Planctomycetota bacterium]